MNSALTVSTSTPSTAPKVSRLQKTGNIYRIQIINAEYTNRVVTDVNALVGSGNPPIFAVVDLEDDTQVVSSLSERVSRELT